MSIDVKEFGFTPVSADDTFQYQCSRCGDCCRDVEDAIMLESYDLFRISKLLKIELAETIERYTEVVFIAPGFPVLMLKTVGPRSACTFLSESSCLVQNAKPRVCRTYPLGEGPDDERPGEFRYFIVSRKKHHFTGQHIRVGDWMDENVSQEERTFILSDYAATAEFGKLIRKIDSRREKDVSFLVLLYKYFAYDLTKDFYEQFVRNMACLKAELSKLAGRSEL